MTAAESKPTSPEDGIKVGQSILGSSPLTQQLHSSICHLRGLLHLRLSSIAQAKDSFIEALKIDVKNYEAFKELIEGGMMTAEEGESGAAPAADMADQQNGSLYKGWHIALKSPKNNRILSNSCISLG